jgi:hypothetical protein
VGTDIRVHRELEKRSYSRMVLTTSEEQQTNASGRTSCTKAFMDVVEEREQERDNDGVHAARGEEFGRLPHLVRGQRHGDLAGRGHDAFGHRQAVAPPDQRFRLPRNVELKREIVRALVTRHVQDVAKTERRDHADPRSAPFDDHVVATVVP